MVVNVSKANITYYTFERCTMHDNRAGRHCSVRRLQVSKTSWTKTKKEGCGEDEHQQQQQQQQGNRRLDFTRAVHSRHPLPADRRCSLSSTCRRRSEPRTYATCAKKLVKTAHVVPEISSRTDRQTHRQTYSSQYNNNEDKATSIKDCIDKSIA